MTTVQTIKRKEMTRKFTHKQTNGLTARTASQRSEVLFFAHPHFLFFNFLATAHSSTFGFCRHAKPKQKTKRA